MFYFDYQVQCSDVINTEDPLSGNCKPQSILIKTIIKVYYSKEGETNNMALIPTNERRTLRGTLHRGMAVREGVRRLWKLVN